jgi:hypothetical protein
VRWVVERTFAWLHNFRRLRIRWDAGLHYALLSLGRSLICWRHGIGFLGAGTRNRDSRSWAEGQVSDGPQLLTLLRWVTVSKGR